MPDAQGCAKAWFLNETTYHYKMVYIIITVVLYKAPPVGPVRLKRLIRFTGLTTHH